MDIIISFGKGEFPKAIFPLPGHSRPIVGAWQETIKAADEANDPGRFTAFIGYEWTSNTGGNNLHRNVIFRDNGTQGQPGRAFTTQPPLGSDNPRDLWKWMADVRREDRRRSAGHRAQRQSEQRPHVPDHRGVPGKEIDREYAETRAQWERLYEATQIKGDGETHPFLSPNDEFADFETLGQGQPRPDVS